MYFCASVYYVAVVCIINSVSICKDFILKPSERTKYDLVIIHTRLSTKFVTTFNNLSKL